MTIPIAVDPSEDLFSITWNIGPRCNYSCSYCPPRLHDKSSAHKSLSEMQAIWQNIIHKTSHKNKKYKLSFTGGEVTVNPNFLDFLSWLNTEYSDLIANIGFTTNGSASKRYYLEAIEHVDYISFSSHFEFANKDKLKSNLLASHIKAIKLKKNIFVNVMSENLQRESVDDLLSWCRNYKIPHSEMKIHWGDHAEARRKLQL